MMDTDELKKILKGSTAVLILDNGDPSFVILGYESYKSLLSGNEEEKEIKVKPAKGLARDKVASPIEFLDSVKQGQETIPKNLDEAIPTKEGTLDDQFRHRINEKESELLEKINKEILALKNEIEKEEKSTTIDG